MNDKRNNVLDFSNTNHQYIHCHRGYVRKIILNNIVLHLYCENNIIEKLDLPESLIFLRCYNNNIKKLYLPPNLECIECDFNVKLYNIPKNCTIRYIRDKT